MTRRYLRVIAGTLCIERVIVIIYIYIIYVTADGKKSFFPRPIFENVIKGYYFGRPVDFVVSIPFWRRRWKFRVYFLVPIIIYIMYIIFSFYTIVSACLYHVFLFFFANISARQNSVLPLIITSVDK